MTEKSLTSALVGSHFRPPAKQLLAALRAGSLLQLVPEPENPYDEHAIKVEVLAKGQVPEGQLGALELALAGAGAELKDVFDSGPVHLGYVISASNKKLGGYASNIAVAGLMKEGPVEARLGFAGDGSPLVVTSRGFAMTAIARGWGVLTPDKGIDLRTVSDTKRAAIVNWLCVGAGLVVASRTTDEEIEWLWRKKCGDVRVGEVSVQWVEEDET